MLVEVSAADISIARHPSGFAESAIVTRGGARAAKVAREQIEKDMGRLAVSPLSAKERKQSRLP